MDDNNLVICLCPGMVGGLGDMRDELEMCRVPGTQRGIIPGERKAGGSNTVGGVLQVMLESFDEIFGFDEIKLLIPAIRPPLHDLPSASSSTSSTFPPISEEPSELDSLQKSDSIPIFGSPPTRTDLSASSSPSQSPKSFRALPPRTSRKMSQGSLRRLSDPQANPIGFGPGMRTLRAKASRTEVTTGEGIMGLFYRDVFGREAELRRICVFPSPLRIETSSSSHYYLLMAPARSYVASPTTFWTPSLPKFERSLDISASNPILLLYRLLRLSWVLFTFPLHIFIVLLLHFIPSFPIPVHVPGRYRSWTIIQRICYPLVSRSIWAIAAMGGAPSDVSFTSERTIPISSRVVEWVGSTFLGWEKVRIWVDDVEPKVKGETWVRGQALDPRGEVLPVTVPCFWLERDVEEVAGWRKARDGERVVLYFVGGGYISGGPAEANRCFELARNTGLRIIGANYRKATSETRSFPAALQDAIVVYQHLVQDLGYRDIVLAGDSAGGGLAVSLLLYLSTSLASSPETSSHFPLPAQVLLYSPWVDLTLSNHRSGIPPEFIDDFLNLSMLNYAVDAYLCNTFPRTSDPALLAIEEKEWESHPFHLGARHPFVSPALLDAKSTLAKLNESYGLRRQRLKFLIISGGAEIFSPDIRDFVKNLKEAALDGGEGGGITVDWREEEDEVHGFIMVPQWVSPAAGRLMKVVTEFLGGEEKFRVGE
ncbi:hypothetical protein P7C70_g182, partial [Phenoliferia sp. Uapishka_3]